MKVSRLLVLLIYRLLLIVAILAGLGWQTHPTDAQPPTCQVTTLASEITYNRVQISGRYVVWTNAKDNTIWLYSIDTGETVILNELGTSIEPQLSGNYVLLPDYTFDPYTYPYTVRLYDIAAKSETVILEDFGQPLRGTDCSDGVQCGSKYQYVNFQLADPIILVYGYFLDDQPMDIFVYDIATQTLDLLPAHMTGYHPWDTPTTTDGQTVVWAEPEPSDETHPSYVNVMRYDIASKTTTLLTTETWVFSTALHGSHIAWSYWADGIGKAIDVYDMRDGSTRTLPVSPIGDEYLMLTGDYVLWGTIHSMAANVIEVYDLRHDTFFTIEANGASSGTFSVPRSFAHAVVWDVYYLDSELHPLTSEVFYYDLANRTQITLTHTAYHNESPSISETYVVWSGDYNYWEYPYLTDDVYLAACETNVMVNGTFEANDDGKAKLPDGWRGVGTLKGDRILTDTLEETFAYSPPHAFQFKGFSGERSRIVSKADLSGHELAQGDILTLSAMVDQRSGVPGAPVVRATVKFANGQQQIYRLRLPKPKITGYVQVSHAKSLKFADVRQIKVEVVYQRASGKFIIDDVKLVLTQAGGISTLISVPDAP